MLKIRVIPTLLWKKFGLVKGTRFDSWRRVGPVLPAIKVYNQREIDELIFLDIAASAENREPEFSSIKDYARDCFVPFTVGGGITQLNQVQKLLQAGADKVCLNTGAYCRPELVTEIAKKHGVQCVVASIDAKKGRNGWTCHSHCGQVDTGRSIEEWSKEMENRGAGELIITSIERDGTMSGYDLELISTVTATVKIPVIASGGAGDYVDMVNAVKQAGASAVAAASMFHFTEKTPKEAKIFLKKSGIPIREPYKDSQI